MIPRLSEISWKVTVPGLTATMTILTPSYFQSWPGYGRSVGMKRASKRLLERVSAPQSYVAPSGMTLLSGTSEEEGAQNPVEILGGERA